MNLFEAVKAAVTPRMAAERYGLPVRQENMVCCPFHADRTPSMKLNEDYFYCFGCGASGDVIDLAARLFGLSGYDAAKKLAAAFSPWRVALPTKKAFASRSTRCCARILRAARLVAPPLFWKRSGWKPTRRSCPFRRIASTLPTARCFSMVSFVPKKNSAATGSPSDMTRARRSR